MPIRRRSALVLVLLAATGCTSGPSAARNLPGGLPQAGEVVRLDPASFTVDVTNRWWPMRPGDRWVYDSADAHGTAQHVEVTVLDETHTVAAGIEARVVHDLVTEG